MGAKGRLLRSLLAIFHSLGGWIAYRLGCSRAARRHYERVLVLRGCDFSAYVQLGRLCFAAGDYAGWRRELEHARRADPRRFAQLRHPFERCEPRLAGTEFDDTGDRATWRSLLPFAPPPLRPQAPRLDAAADGGRDRVTPGGNRRTDAIADAPVGPCGDAAPLLLPRDDCMSANERQRLAALGPIRATDVAGVDVDELARRLSG
ncbi:MAG: hypothetical protein KF830_15420 [Planctomycetes bacterium]|nr:hypothetical protein [Planctomycetota bacterium]